jgi:hypothetical protein
MARACRNLAWPKAGQVVMLDLLDDDHHYHQQQQQQEGEEDPLGLILLDPIDLTLSPYSIAATLEGGPKQLSAPFY